MALEIERKFLVEKRLIPVSARNIRIIQYYLCTDPERTVRIRLADERAFLTVKGRGNGLVRPEYEYPIPAADARAMMSLAVSTPVEKVRRELIVGGKKWEVDFFEGENSGLVLAEIELEREDEEIVLPEWIDREVTGDWRYHNSFLSRHPYRQWI
ncbi:MAG: CYTH domain-containing protein [Mangrovibacterium sp.]